VVNNSRFLVLAERQRYPNLAIWPLQQKHLAARKLLAYVSL